MVLDALSHTPKIGKHFGFKRDVLSYEISDGLLWEDVMFSPHFMDSMPELTEDQKMQEEIYRERVAAKCYRRKVARKKLSKKLKRKK